MKKFGFGLLAFGLVALLLLEWGVPYWIRKTLPEQVLRACPSCTFELENVAVHLWRRELILSQVRWVQGSILNTRVEASALQVRIRVSLPFRIDHLELGHLQVLVQEGDGRATQESSELKSESGARFIDLKTVEFSDAHFEYRRIDKKADAVIRVSKIHGTLVSSLGTQADLWIQAQANGLLEQSGRFELKLEVPSLGALLRDPGFAMQVDLIVREQKLNELNPYFDSHNGIHLSGVLKEGQSHVWIQNRHARVMTRVRYDGLGIRFQKNQDRSATAAWASNWVGSFRLIESNLKSRNPSPPTRASLAQNPNETVLQMILRGMKVTALSAATR